MLGATRGVPLANGPAKPAGVGRLRDSLWSAGGAAPNTVRPSRGIEEFFRYIHGQSGLNILDLGGASQQNISFITGLGHRLYSEDHPPACFDGVLIWDVLEYLAPALLNAVIERLHKTVRPRSYMLAFFHSDDKLEAVPSYTFRIQQMNALEVAPHGMRRPAQLFNNRSLEKLFGRFESQKFFLTRERLREVIVKA